jgi:hypothetical protein
MKRYEMIVRPSQHGPLNVVVEERESPVGEWVRHADSRALLVKAREWGISHKRSCPIRASNFQTQCECGRDALAAELNEAIFGASPAVSAERKA